MTLRHVTLTAADPAASLAFYDAVLATVGMARLQEYGDEEEDPADVPLDVAGFGPPAGEPVLWIVAGPVPTRGAHIAFDAVSPQDVDRFYAAALAHGGSARHAPRRWEIYRPGSYGALVADPDANLIEAIAPEATVPGSTARVIPRR